MKKVILVLCIAALALAGCTAKPSKEEVKKAFKKVLQEEYGTTATEESKAAVEDYSNCVIDESYDDLSAKTLKKFVDAKSSAEFQDVDGSQKEKDALDEAAEKCSEKLISAAGQ